MSQDNFRFKELNAELLRNSRSVLSSWFPNGVVRGNEFVIGDIHGSAGDSLSVNLEKGVWSDFATGQSGADLISLYAASKGLTQGQALNDLGGKKTKVKPAIKDRISYRYTEDYVVERIDYVDGTKAFYGKYKGTNKHHPEPRPLYFVEGFNPEKPILIVEGEKAAHAAHEIIGEYYSVITWSAGSNSFKKADWKSLIDKGAKVLSVLIWPDFDEPGYKAAAGVAAILKPMGFDVSILDVKKNNPLKNIEGWDAYDLLQLNWTQAKFIEWAKSCKTEVGKFVEPEKEKVEKKKEEKDIASVEPIGKPRSLAELPERKPTNIDEENISHIQSIPGLEKTNSGKTICNALNMRIILSHHPAFKDRFFFDEFFGSIFIRDGEGLRKLNDVDLTNIMLFMQRAGLDKATKNNVNDAIDSIADANRISQPRMEIEKYEWDGKPRIEKFFTDYFVSDYPIEYLEAVGKNFWISMIARIYSPGCKVDNMVVIESRSEGIYKSTALKVIGGKYFSEANGKLGSKDFLENTNGYFLLEDDELVATTGVSAEQQKSFISRSYDTYRKAYGRFSTDKKRQWIMVGTTNEDEYLDSRNSEGRRFWPVKVTKVNLDMIKEDREQLFAEAREQFKSGATWWEVPKEIHLSLFNSKNMAVSAEDPWKETISDFIARNGGDEIGRISSKDILDKILMIELNKQTRRDTIRVGRIMKELGFQNKIFDDVGFSSRRMWFKFNPNPFVFPRRKDEPPSNYNGW